MTLRLYKGNLAAGQPQVAEFAVLARTSRASPWAPNTTRRTRCGFINLIGLPIKVRALAEAAEVSKQRMKLWGGRFEDGPSEVFERFSGSLHFDRRLIYADIRGSQAFARALRARRHPDGGRVRDSWSQAFERSATRRTQPKFFDGRDRRRRPYARHPQARRERVGGLADKIHTGRSRNEQVSLDMRLWLRDEIDALRRAARRTDARAARPARDKYPDAVIPGYTHLRRAQAVLWPHYLLAYFEMFARDFERLEQARARVERDAARVGRAGGQRIPVRSRGHRAGPGIRRDHPQQHGCLRRSRLRARFPVRGIRRPCCT